MLLNLQMYKVKTGISNACMEAATPLEQTLTLLIFPAT